MGERFPEFYAVWRGLNPIKWDALIILWTSWNNEESSYTKSVGWESGSQFWLCATPNFKRGGESCEEKSWENDNGGGGTTGKKNWLSCQEQWSCVGKFFSVLLSILASKSHSSGSSVQCMSLSFSAGSLQFFPPMLNFKKFLSLIVRQNQHQTISCAKNFL